MNSYEIWEGARREGKGPDGGEREPLIAALS